MPTVPQKTSKSDLYQKISKIRFLSKNIQIWFLSDKFFPSCIQYPKKHQTWFISKNIQNSQNQIFIKKYPNMIFIRQIFPLMPTVPQKTSKSDFYQKISKIVKIRFLSKNIQKTSKYDFYQTKFSPSCLKFPKYVKIWFLYENIQKHQNLIFIWKYPKTSRSDFYMKISKNIKIWFQKEKYYPPHDSSTKNHLELFH